MTMPWTCPKCGHPIDEPDRAKLAALKEYHDRTKHGAQNIRPSSGSSKSSGSSGIVEDILEGVGDVIGGIFKIFD